MLGRVPTGLHLLSDTLEHGQFIDALILDDSRVDIECNSVRPTPDFTRLAF
jgi:hypothetical protein